MQKARTVNEKTDKLKFIKMINCCVTSTEGKYKGENVTMLQNKFAIDTVSDKRPPCRIY